MAITKISPSVVDFDAGITISTADNTDTLTLTSTDADDNSGPNLNMYRNSSSAADADVLGQVKFTGKNDAGSPEDIVYGSISGKITDASDGTEDGNLRFFTMAAGTSTETLTLSSSNVGAGTTAPLLRITSVDSGTGGASTSGNVGVTHGNANILIGGHNESNSATYSGIALETRTSGASRWLIANEWQSTYLGDLVFHRRTGGSASAEALRITNAGNLKMPSGQGIDFSATGDVTGSASEVLDDYEEGIFAPTVGGAGGGSFGLSTNSDHLAYTKIGRQVTVTGYLDITSDSSVSGSLRFTLPYAVENLADDSEYTFSALALINNGSDLADYQKYIFAYTGSYAYLYRVEDNGAGSYIDHGDVDTAFQIGFNFSYFAAT